MKRVICSVILLVLCLSLCVNVAFADTVSVNMSSGINVYFPWFGGVSSSGSRVTNYGTVTSSDITSSGLTLTNLVTGSVISSNGLSFSYNNGVIHVTGTANNTYANIFSPSITLIDGHKYYFDSFNENIRVWSDITGTIRNPTNVIFNGVSGVFNMSILTTRNTVYDFYFSPLLIDLTEAFGAGNEPTDVSFVSSIIASVLGNYNFFTGSIFSGISSFSLVPRTGNPNFSLSNSINDYQYYNFEADVSLDGSEVITQNYSDYFVSGQYDPYLISYRNISSGRYVYYLVYSTYNGAQARYNYFISTLDPTRYDSFNLAAYTWGSVVTNGSFNSNPLVEVDGDLLPLDYSSGLSSITSDVTFVSITSSAFTIFNGNDLVGFNDFSSSLNSDRLIGNGDSTFNGTISINRILSTTDYIYFYNNNYINSGAYDFNVNIKFPSLDKFNNFSGVWSATVNTSWGEVPVRTQVQEVSSNVDTLIKIYKLTFDVPVTGQYTKFNIKYFGSSDVFTTIRIDASVVDPNFLDSGAPSSIKSFSYWLSSKFDQFWAKVRSLFLDQDQTMQESIPSELAEQNNTVRSGTEAIHDFETQTFDNIDQTQESIDWETPNSFGSVDSSGSAIGFVASIFTSFFNSIGSNMQNIIVIPLVLGLVLVVLGRGQLALGRALSAPKPKPKGGRK